MRVLILSQYFWPESFRINEVAQSLREAGCDVSILTGQPNYPEGATYEGYRAFSTRRESYGGCVVHRVPLAPRGGGGALRLFANYVSFVVAASLIGPWLLRGQKFDVIFVYGISPPLQAIPGMILRRTTGGALVLWVQDLWPQSLEATGFVRSPRLLRAAGRLVRWIYRKCDLLLTQSIGFIVEVRKLSGTTPVEYHPNPGERGSHRSPSEEPALRLERGFNVVFAGNLGTLQALDTILAAAQLLRNDPQVRFVLVGSGSRGAWVHDEIKRLGLTNVNMPGRYQQEQMSGILSQASALLVTLVPNPVTSQTIPSKIQSYLAVGRPIIASLDGEGARVIEESDSGIACPAGDATALARAVEDLRARSAPELTRLGENGRRYYQQHFEPMLLAERLKQRFTALRDSRAHADSTHD